MTDANFLKALYYDPSRGFLSLDKFYKKVHAQRPDIKYQDIVNFLAKQYTNQINKEIKKPKLFSTILANKIADNFQIDIIIYDRYELNSYKYILCVVDVHSRYAQCRALTNRENDTIIKNLMDIFKVMGVPKNVNADNEFNTKKINDYFDSLGIVKHYSEVGEINKNAIVERFNRTLAGLIQKWRVGTGEKRWYKVLNELVDNYNHTFHRTMKQTPADIFEGLAESKQSPIIQMENEFNVGDLVRIKIVKDILGKGDYLKYSTDTYLIESVNGKRYKLRNTRIDELERKMYKDYELKKVGEIETIPVETKPIEDLMVERKKTRRTKAVLTELADHMTAPPRVRKSVRLAKASK